MTGDGRPRAEPGRWRRALPAWLKGRARESDSERVTESVGPADPAAHAPADGEPAAAVAAGALLLSSALLVYLSLTVPGYIRSDWTTAFAATGVPCLVVGVLLLVRRRLSSAGLAVVVLFGDVAIVLSAYASQDRNGTTAGALLSLPTLFSATFLRARWLAVQVAVAAVCAWIVNALVPAVPGVHLIRTTVLVVACTCPAVIVVLLRRQLDRAILTDPLTGLANRRGLESRFPVQAARARRAGRPLVVLVTDVDHFKQVNDRHGHLAGDEVLRSVAATTLRCVRPEDLVVRMGGEEIMVVLVALPHEAGAVAERIRREVEGTSAGPHPVTVSVGVAWAAADGDDRALLDRLVQEADDRMYAAKRSGRNRVVLPADGAAHLDHRDGRV